MDFSKVAPYLQDPLVLIGFVVFLGFLFVRYLVKKGIIPELPPRMGYMLLRQILHYGFIVGLLIICLGFGLKYRNMSDAEQSRVLRLLQSEFSHNRTTVDELIKNTINILERMQDTAKALRTDGIEVLEILFPEENLEASPSLTVPRMVDSAFDQLASSGVLDDELEMRKFTAAGQRIKLAIDNTMGVMRSLQDESNTRYTIESKVWESNLSIYRKIDTFDVGVFQESLEELENIRRNYAVVYGHVVDYLTSVENFFAPQDSITRRDLHVLLSKERFTLDLVNAYASDLVDSAEDLEEIEKTL